MKNLKKLVSVILTVAMLVSSLAALSVSAAYDDVDASNSYAKAIEVLSGLGIAKGDDEGNFNPTADVKRSEMVAFICRMKGEESIATATGSKFDDVAENHWANGYINWGVDNGIIKGYGDGNFGPDASVTYQDALVMILRAAGWERVCERSDNGGYPAGYIKIAKQQGLTSGITFSTEKAATREVVAQAIYNGLTMPTVAISKYASNPDDDEYTIYDGSDGARRTLLTYTNEIYKVKAVVDETAKSLNTLADEDGDKVRLDITDDYNNYARPANIPTDLDAGSTDVEIFVGDSNVADYHKYTVEAYITEYDVNDWVILAVVPDTKSVDAVTVSAVKNDIKAYDDVADTFTYRETKKSTKDIELDIAGTPAVYYNGRLLTAYDALDDLYSDTLDLEALLEDYADEITFVGADDLYTSIFVTDYAYGQVKEVVEDDLYIELETSTFASTIIDLDPEARANEKLVCNIYDAEGNEIELADIAEDDILNIVAPLYDEDAANGYDLDEIDYIDIYVTSNAVTGVVDEDHGDGTYTIEGNVYGALDATIATALSAFPEGVFYITIDGKVYATDSETTISKNFAIILGHEVATKFGKTVAEVQAFTAEGELKTFTVASEVKVGGTKYKRSDNSQATIFGTEGSPNAGTIDEKYADIAYNADADAALVAQTANLKTRLFSYKTNSDGELTEITFAAASGAFAYDYAYTDYKASTEVFDGNDAVVDTVIIEAPYTGTTSVNDWNIDTDELDITTFASLVKDDDYHLNYYILNDDGEIAVATTAKAVTSATGGSHFAVVTGVGTIYDKANDDSVAKYTFIQSGEEVTATVAYGATVDTLAVGDVFRYGVDAEGRIDSIDVIYDGSSLDASSATSEEAIAMGTVTDVGTTTSGKRYIIVGGSRVLFADAEGASFISVDTAELPEAAAVKALSGAAAIRKTTTKTQYDVVTLCDEDGLIIDAVMFIIPLP